MEALWSAPARRVWLSEASDLVGLRTADLRRPFAALIVATQDEPDSVRGAIADALVAGGCRHAACWGADCEAWQSSVDEAYLATRPDHQPDDETMVMTTTHPRELVIDAVWYLLFGSDFREVRFEDYLVLYAGDDPLVLDQVRAAVRRLLSN